MTPGTRREYARRVGGSPLSQEDAWHRAVEFLFERLAVRGRRGHRPDHAPEGAARAASASPRRPSARWIRDVLREHLAENFPELRRRRDRPPTPSPRCSATTASRRAGPAGRSSARPRSPRRCCSRSSARCSTARPGRCCARRSPSRSRSSGRRRATAHLDGFPPADLAEAEASTRCCASTRRRTRARWRASTPRA